MIIIQYKLYKDVDDSLDTTTQILTNRGIPRDKVKDWLNAGWESIYDWSELDNDGKMTRAVDIVAECIEEEQDICFNVDCDVDGYSSSAIIINYLFKTFPNYAVKHVFWIHHEGKAHGFSDMIQDIIDKSPALVIAPDGGSNDYKQHEELNKNGIKVLCLDHHECTEDYSNDDTLIVNVQISDYPNKALTGAGVAYKFISAFEDLVMHGNQPQEFMDLCALGNIGDMSDYRQMETRAIVNIGLSGIRNPFFATMATTNDYSIQKMNGMNYYSCAFYVVPFINAICRSGTMEEKDMVFKSMLTQTAFDRVPSSKKGEKDIQVPRYQEAVVVAQRVKRRQTKLQDEAMTNIEKKIAENHLIDNAVILVELEPDECEAAICGLAANKVQSKYQHPSIILRRTKAPESSEYVFSGSLRNYSLCSIKNFASLCRSTGLPEFVAGHEGAAGVSIKESNIPAFIEATNELYKDIDFTPTYWVDYIWKKWTVEPNRILDLGYMNIYGQEIPESLIVVEDISLDESNVTLMGAKRNTIKIMCGNVACILFQTDEDTYQEMISGNKKITIVGTGNANEWNGNVSSQIIIKDYELSEQEEWVF